MTTITGRNLGGGAFLLLMLVPLGLNGGAARAAADVTFAGVAGLATVLRSRLG